MSAGAENKVINVVNASGGPTIINSGSALQRIGAYLPDPGRQSATVVVWESNGSYAAQRTADGVIISSGDVWDEVMRVGVLAAADAPGTGGTVFVRAGSYNVESGVTISGDVSIIGEGGLGASLQAGTLAGTISGIFKMAETASTQRISNFDIQCNSGAMLAIHVHSNSSYARIDNVLIQYPSATVMSGSKAISLNNVDDCSITNIKEIRNWDNGIYLNGLSCNDNTIDNVTFVGCNYGVVVNGGAENIISNIIGGSANDSGIVLLESGARRNIVTNILGRFSFPTVVARFSSIDNYIDNICNTSGNTAISIQDNARNRIGASFPEAGIIPNPQYTIWESGGVYNAIRNADGVTIVSGTNFPDLFATVLTRNALFGGTILLKAGSYIMTSGVSVSGSYVTEIRGEGKNSQIDISGFTGRISGALEIYGDRLTIRDIALNAASGVMKVFDVPVDATNLLLENVDMDGPGKAQSGTNAVYFPAGFDCRVQNCTFDGFDEGIRLDNSISSPDGIAMNNLVLYNMNTGIMLDNVFGNSAYNINTDNSTSGGIILQGQNTRRNIVDGIIGNISGLPIVVVQTSGEHNRITNIVNRSTNGVNIVDFTSGVRNFMLPGLLDPIVLISGASPFTYVNASGRQEMITVGGGTVSLIEFVRRGTTTALSGLTAGTFILNGGDKLTVTYSAAPAVKVIPTG